MKKRTKFTIFLATSLCILCFVCCTPNVPDEAEIVILSWNDLHGNFEHLPKMAAFVKQTKAKYKRVIVVDAGDHFTGNPFNDFHRKKQYPIVDLLNHIGLQVSVLGNHEFDFGVELLNERIADAKNAVIAANIDLQTSGLVGVKPYHIVNKKGIKVAFLGLTQVDRLIGKPSTLAKHVENIQFFDPIETAIKYRALRTQAHVFVALTHIGIPVDLILADSMPELDLIIGGHSHAALKEPLIQNGVTITQAERLGRYVGKTTIRLKKGVVTEVHNELICMVTWEGPVDSSIARKIERYKKNPFLSTPFVTLQYKIPTLTQLGHLMTDAALALPNVDFSLMNCGGIRIQYLPAGAITYADILRLSPFGNYLMIIDLTPSEIRELIEIEFTDRKNCLNIPAGFEYTARLMPDNTIKVERMTYPNGKELDENKRYTLALNNYLVTRYLTEYMDRAIYSGVYVVDNIVEFLKNNPNVDYQNMRDRARFID